LPEPRSSRTRSPGLEHADELLAALAYMRVPVAGDRNLADCRIRICVSVECIDTLDASKTAGQSFNVNHAIKTGTDQRVNGNSIQAGHQRESLESRGYIAR
jgi:hypothetical protein